MNLHPVAGDRWTRKGKPEIVVKEVSDHGVLMTYGGAKLPWLALDDYLALAAASVKHGDTLHRTETEECLFE